MEDSYHIKFVDEDRKIIKTQTTKFDRYLRLSDLDQPERIEKLKSAYLYNREIMLRTVRRIIRLYTHQDKNDIKLLVRDEIASYLKFFDAMEDIAQLLFSEACPLADDILDEFLEFNFEKAFEIEADKETIQKPITNADILKECENSKNEILGMLKTFAKNQEKFRPPNIIKNLIDAGQLKQEPDSLTGKYIALKSPYDFLCWCFENGYADDINAVFVMEHIKTKCSLETLKKYERDARDITETKQKSRRIHGKRINPV